MFATSFCAICASDIIGDVVREPLGKLGALVAVCVDCRTKTPTANYGKRPAYDPEDKSPETAEILRRRAAQRDRAARRKARLAGAK
jgi:hypothetical protein